MPEPCAAASRAAPPAGGPPTARWHDGWRTCGGTLAVRWPDSPRPSNGGCTKPRQNAPPLLRLMADENPPRRSSLTQFQTSAADLHLGQPTPRPTASGPASAEI